MRTPFLRNEIDAVVASDWPEECVIFSGREQPNGYGRVSIDGVYRRSHVYACERAHGPRPEGKREVAHSCNEAMCINPRHLRWATRAENEFDKRAIGHSNEGQRSGSAKLTDDIVRAIRLKHATTAITQQKLADEYGVHIMTINDILLHRTWRHLLDGA